MAKIKVKNRKTGVESEMTNDEWEKTKKNPLFEGVFVVVQKTETPPEVEALKAKAQAEKTSDKTKNQTEK